jgi:hypothetical protein
LQQLCGIALGLPAVHLGEALLELGGTVAVLLGHLGLGVERVALFHVLPQGLISHEHRVHHAVRVVFEVVLFQYRQALSRAKLHSALVGLEFAGDGAQQCRLSGAVGTYHTVNISTSKLDVYIFVQHSFAKLNGKVRQCYHLKSVPN